MTPADLDWLQFWREAGDGFALVDGMSIIQAVNPAFERLSGYSAGELCGLKVQCLLDGLSWPAFVETGSGWCAGDVQLKARGGKQAVSASLTLAPGDTLLLYTDGIIEAQNPAGRFFGLQRLTEAFVRQAGQPSEVIVEGLMAALNDFRGSEVFDDDVSLVVLQVDGSGENVV